MMRPTTIGLLTLAVPLVFGACADRRCDDRSDDGGPAFAGKAAGAAKEGAKFSMPVRNQCYVEDFPLTAKKGEPKQVYVFAYLPIVDRNRKGDFELSDPKLVSFRCALEDEGTCMEYAELRLRAYESNGQLGPGSLTSTFTRMKVKARAPLIVVTDQSGTESLIIDLARKKLRYARRLDGLDSDAEVDCAP